MVELDNRVNVAAAAISEDEVITFRLPDGYSVFSAEPKAIEITLRYENERYFCYIIFTDPLASM